MADDHDNEFDDDKEFGIDQKRMPFTDHLVELRYRILVCLVTVAVVFFLLFFVFGKELFHVLERPVMVTVQEYKKRNPDARVDPRSILVSLKPTSAFVTSAVVSLMAAIALTIPVTIYHIWAFVAPGLKRKERKAIVPIFTVGTVLFVTGMAFCYFVVLRFVLGFLLSFTLDYGMQAVWNIGDTIKFEAVLMIVFGAAFELPLVIVALTKMGVITPQQLAAKRRHAIVIAFIAAALLTPPDVVSQVSLAVPLIILLEISIHVSKFFRPKGSFWDRWDEEEDDDQPPPSPEPSGPDESPGDSYMGDAQDEYGYSEDHYEDHDPYSDEYGYEDDSYGQSGYDPEEEQSDHTGEETADEEEASEPEAGRDAGNDDAEARDAESQPSDDVAQEEDKAVGDEEEAGDEEADETADEESEEDDERLYEGYERLDDDEPMK